MADGIQQFTELLIKSYNNYIDEFFGYELKNMPEDGDGLAAEFIESRWGDAPCSILGKTPKEAIGDFLPEEIDFNDIVYMFDTFAREGVYDVPDVVCDLLFSAPPAAEEYMLSVICGMDLSINGDKVISDAENETLCVFIEALKNIHRISPDKAREKLFKIFSEVSAENYLINETVCDAMEKCGFVAEMISYIDGCGKIGEKEHFILQKLVKISGANEDVFRCLKACLKKDCENISMTVQIVSDCGDGRLIPLMRKIARNQLKTLFEAGRSPYDESRESQEFFLICNAITRLGGSIEDLLMPE